MDNSANQIKNRTDDLEQIAMDRDNEESTKSKVNQESIKEQDKSNENEILTRSQESEREIREKEKLYFRRTSKLMRTPPTSRESSCDSLREKGTRRGSLSSSGLEDTTVLGSSSSQQGSANKRKRTEVKNPEYGLNPEGILKSILSKIHDYVLTLDNVVKETYKPKKEFVDLSIKLTREIEKLKSEAVTEWIENLGSRRNAKQEELKKENEDLRRQIRLMNKQQGMTVKDTEPLGNQCDECIRVLKLKTRRNELKIADSFECFQAVTEQDWIDGVFTEPTTTEGFVWDAPTECDVILPCNENFKSNFKNVSRAIEKFGGIEHLKEQDKKQGEIAMMLYAIGFPKSDGTLSRISRCIYYPIHSDRNNAWEIDDQILFQALVKVKKRLLEDGKTHVCIPETENVMGLQIRRMIQFLIADTEIKLIVYKPYEEKRNTTGQRDKPGMSTKNVNKHEASKNKKKLKQDAIIISRKDTTYADLLKTIKTAVNPNELGVEVHNIKKTQKGDLLLTIKNGADKAEVLRKELIDKVPDAKTSLLISRKILHLKGMDETINEDEIREAISNTLNIARNNFEIRALRPAYGGRQNATLKMTEVDADRLLEAKTIQIGWTKCGIVERDQLLKCFKCWELGHREVECKGPDRKSLCLKCGKPGHMVSKCVNESFCLDCKAIGHRTGSKSCKMEKGNMTRDCTTLQQNVQGTTD